MPRWERRFRSSAGLLPWLNGFPQVDPSEVKFFLGVCACALRKRDAPPQFPELLRGLRGRSATPNALVSVDKFYRERIIESSFPQLGSVFTRRAIGFGAPGLA
jgi:hypothetical protein